MTNRKFVMQERMRTMTVDELKSILDRYSGDTKVAFAYPYGDRVQTDVVSQIDDAEYGDIVWSEQHRMFKLIPEDADMDYYNDDDMIQVLVLK